MFSLAALVIFSMAPGLQERPVPDPGSVDRLIAELGASDPQERDRAESELKKIGRSAVPALREAARSNNAERAMRARSLLLEFARQKQYPEKNDSGSPTPRMSVVYEDWTRGIRFQMSPDGAVELTAPTKEEGADRREYRTYQAASLEEFKKKYPEIAKKVDLDRLVSAREIPFDDERLREWLGLRDEDSRWQESPSTAPWRGGPSEGKDEPEGRRFGILIRPVDPTLASQLGLGEGAGLVVQRIEPGSIAEKSGVKPYDVIVKLNDQEVRAGKTEDFRKSLQDALGKKEFTLELLRAGKRETLHVKPPAEKEAK